MLGNQTYGWTDEVSQYFCLLRWKTPAIPFLAELLGVKQQTVLMGITPQLIFVFPWWLFTVAGSCLQDAQTSQCHCTCPCAFMRFRGGSQSSGRADPLPISMWSDVLFEGIPDLCLLSRLATLE